MECTIVLFSSLYNFLFAIELTNKIALQASWPALFGTGCPLLLEDSCQPGTACLYTAAFLSWISFPGSHIYSFLVDSLIFTAHILLQLHKGAWEVKLLGPQISKNVFITYSNQNWQFAQVQNSRQEITFSQFWRDCSLPSSFQYCRSETWGYTKSWSFIACDCFLFLEAWRICSLSSVFWNFTVIYFDVISPSIHAGHSMGLLTWKRVSEICEIILSTSSAPPLSLLSGTPVIYKVDLWSLLKSYVVSYYFYLVLFAWLSGRLPHNFIFQSFELFVFGPHHMADGILVPQSAIEPMLPEAQSPNLWTTQLLRFNF